MSHESFLVHTDAIDILDHLRPSSADTAYLDPPFCVGTRFRARAGSGLRAVGPVAYDDQWSSLEAYLAWLEPRIVVARDALAPHGTLWLHLDQRAVHEAKSVCDRVFGRKRFRGEIVWVPGNGSKTRRGPALGHQTLLLYARGSDPIWNARDPARGRVLPYDHRSDHGIAVGNRADLRHQRRQARPSADHDDRRLQREGGIGFGRSDSVRRKFHRGCIGWLPSIC